jgi:[protein-PII] uridylyltransferase
VQTRADTKAALETADAELKRRFLAGDSVVRLVHERAWIVDGIIRDLWHTHAAGLVDEVALVAVGGYGRGELHPHSDVDIMLLLPTPFDASGNERLSAFVTALWDAGLEIGQSVRTVEQCFIEAEADLTVATTLMEARLLDGPKALFRGMEEAVSPDRVWPSNRFFEEKRKEQIARHHRYDDTAYKLEPNV